MALISIRIKGRLAIACKWQPSRASSLIVICSGLSNDVYSQCVNMKFLHLKICTIVNPRMCSILDQRLTPEFFSHCHVVCLKILFMDFTIENTHLGFFVHLSYTIIQMGGVSRKILLCF